MARIFLLLYFIFINTIPSYTASISSNPKVVVVGGGASGIAAAVKLLEYGFQDVTVLEAEPRIGGRIHTIRYADNVIDLGAQWCHGEKNNVVYQLAKDLGLLEKTKGVYDNAAFIRSNGERIPEYLAEPISKMLRYILSKRRTEDLSLNVSAHEFLKSEFLEAIQLPEFRHIDKKIATEAFYSSERDAIDFESSDNLTIIAARGDPEYEECQGDQALNWRDKGFKTIYEILMKTSDIEMHHGVLQNRIRLSKKVKRIDWKRDDNRALIHCEDGEDILADHVIVTVSIGVLKDNYHSLFVPVLPVRKQTAINEINFGSVTKVFMEFDKQFWPDNWIGFKILWTDEDLQKVRGTEKFWWEGISDFYVVDFQPRVFEAWVIGPSARYMETLDENYVRDNFVQLLKQILRWDIPKPINITYTKWYNNPNFRGTYSYHSIQMLKSGITPRDLNEPLTVNVRGENQPFRTSIEKPVVLFGGEATSVHHYGNVHGAIESGWNEAKRLAEFHRFL